MRRPLTCVIHGESGAGKSNTADTVPKPALVFDAEAGSSAFTPSRKVEWNPLVDPPPEPDGTWDTCVVTVREYRVLETAVQWLASGKHPFRSVVFDSLTSIQKRCLDAIAGTAQPQEAQWGDLLRQMESLIQRVTDLTVHPTKPLDVVVFVCLTHFRDGKFRPFVKGQLELTLPGFVSVVGYQYAADKAEGGTSHWLMVQPQGQFLAKDRTRWFTRVAGATCEVPDPEDPTQDQLLAKVWGAMNESTEEA